MSTDHDGSQPRSRTDPRPLPGRGAADPPPAPPPDLGRGRDRRAGPDHRRVRHEPGIGAPPTTSSDAGAPLRRPRPVRPTATPEPTPVPTPEAELHIWNYAEYMGEDVIPSFEKKYNVKVSSDFFDTYEGMYARVTAGQTGFDITFPASTDIPGLVAIGKILPLDLSLIPNKVNLGAEWSNPGYDPGNAHSMPYMWWTTGVAYDTAKIKETPTSWKALWDERWKGHIAMLDDQREAFAAALIQLELQREHRRRRAARPGARPAQAAAPAGPPVQRRGPAVHGLGRHLDRPCLGLRHLHGPAEEAVGRVLHPRGGLGPRIGRGGHPRGAKNPIAANLFINHLLDAKVSAENSNYIGYMGPNEAAKAVHHQGPPRHALDQPRQGHRRQAPGAARPGPRHSTSTRRAGPS